MRVARRYHLVLASILIVAALIYGIAVLGDFFLMRAINAQADLLRGDARRLMAERHQTQDLALIAQAENEGFERRIILPLLVEETPRLKAIADTYGFAPLGLQADARLYICNEGHGALKLTTDRFGFRNDDRHWDSPDVDTVLVGDSFAFGACQPQADTIAGRLAGLATLNLSFPGALPVHYAAMIRTFGPKISTGRMVVVFYPNDKGPLALSPGYHDWFFGPDADISGFFATVDPPTPSPVHRDFYGIARAEARAQRSAAAPAPNGAISRNMARVGKVLKHASLPALRSQIRTFWLAGQDASEGTRLAIGELSRHCAEAGCAPLVVYIPNSPFWDPDPTSAEYAATIGQISAGAGVEFLDMTAPLSELGRDGYADLGIHLSAAGYALVADAINAHFAR